MNKKRNNKGFSLVELIVVIAVMAILVGVLAPAYLRYVEKSKVQKDVSAVAEVVEAIKIAASEEAVANEIPSDGSTVTITVKDNTTLAATPANLMKEIKATVGDKIDFTSTAMGSKAVDIAVKRDSNYNLTITVGASTTDGVADTTALSKLTALSE